MAAAPLPIPDPYATRAREPQADDPYAHLATAQRDVPAAHLVAASAPAGQTIQATSPGFWSRVHDTVANSPLGSAIEQTMPKLADALNLHPTMTQSSPDYRPMVTDRPIVPLQYLAPANPTSTLGHVGRGLLRGVGQMTTPGNLATAAGVAATAGLAAPALGAAGTAGTVARLGAKGLQLGAAAVGAHGVYKDASNAYGQYQQGDTGGALESMGAALPNAVLTLPALGGPLETLGDAAQRGGVGIINRTIGARSADFARGANPGEGYFQAGLGPSLSLDSIASKAKTALQSTGTAIGDASKAFEGSGGLIPYEDGAAAIRRVIAGTRDALLGPGGTGDSTALDQYEATWAPLLDSAQQRGGFLPTEYAAAKRNAAGNTTWGDPAQAGMKELRQQTVGAMGGQLVNAMPELGDLNNRYQNLLKLTDRATDRAATGSLPLAGLVRKGVLGSAGAASGVLAHDPLLGAAAGVGGLTLDSVPARTAAAYSVFYGGKGLSAAARWLGGVGQLQPSLIADDARGAARLPFDVRLVDDAMPDLANPSAAPYSLRNLTPEIIRPGDISRSTFGVGADGRGGTLIRPLGALPAPAYVPPVATPYQFNTAPPAAIPAISRERLAQTIGTAAHTVPSSLLGPVVSPGAAEAQAAALRRANLGSVGAVVPDRLLTGGYGALLPDAPVSSGAGYGAVLDGAFPARAGVQPKVIPTKRR